MSPTPSGMGNPPDRGASLGTHEIEVRARTKEWWLERAEVRER